MMGREDWAGLASRLDIASGLFIEGQYVNARSGKTFDCLNPATDQIIAKVAQGDVADIDLAVASAQAALRDGRWRSLAPRTRASILLRLADLVEVHTQELALLETLDMGKPISDVLNIDIPEVVNTLRYFAECIDKIEGGVTATPVGTLHTITHEPLGVVGAITPWNYPLMMAVWKLAPALAAGNCVVLKPAEQAPLSCTRLAQLFVDAGGPPGVFNVVNGLGPEAGKALALHPDVAKLTFTGSTAVGKLLLGYAGQSNMKRVALETGGKSPQILMPDLYDLDAAVDRAVGGIFDNAGQVCNAGSRLLVHQSLHDEFVQRFIARAQQAYQTGDPLDPATTLGPMVSQTQRQNVQARIDQAISDGAKPVLGGLSPDTQGAGAYLQPCVFTGADNTMRIVREEVFGPVATVQAFETEEQALAMANDSDYGLAASVWTADLKTAHRMVGALQAGVVWVNCFGDGDMTQPFGGYKQSGNSRDKHKDSLLSYMQTKSAWFQLG
ncbi:aldehyde dehydrogenase PuuC [Hydrogenophaga crassostreae]|uniref:Aldehyde dehydrogenase PuuC n=2 Tax=Hydrogenophaga crassostreae TaxID=1763535 RepID=A0A162Z7P0_9BURK|nr:aldehyde dehydrogenase [Hydrogenophaga crassostreae]AOW13878.1 aldehyde dehydrogenase PuuC [Hydrogenophaga crassostreae]OAD44162.1 aldehyde dehydrogenase PuuC [Hydrogenophaga crassostreae]